MFGDYPQGDGRPDCPECQGRGVVRAPVSTVTSPYAVCPQTRVCKCVLMRDVIANVERGWKGLMAAPPIPSSPLRGRETESLLIVTTVSLFQRHLRHVACRMGPRWFFQVVTDADLMEAWLSKDLPEEDIADPDVNFIRGSRPTRYSTLMELVEPPELLVLRLGVKVARNRAMPEVLLEALQHRQHRSQPTWVVDLSYAQLGEEHVSWSPQVEEFLGTLARVSLREGEPLQLETLGESTEQAKSPEAVPTTPEAPAKPKKKGPGASAKPGGPATNPMAALNAIQAKGQKPGRGSKP